MNYESVRTIESKSCPGVQFTIVKMTFARRLELTREVRKLAGQLEYQMAGSSAADKLDAVVTTLAVDELYLRWGLRGLTGIQIDGVEADSERLLESGPEDLCREIVAEIKHECGLTEEERKN